MKQQKQLMVLGGLVLLALIVWYFNRTRPAVVAGSAATYQNYNLLTVDNPELHRDKLEAVQKTEYKPSGRNPFSEIAPPPPQDIAKHEAATRPFIGPQKPPPDPPPSLPGNVKFFGYGTIPNGTARRAFLSDGDEIYIVGEGDTLLGRFRIVKINNANLEFEETSTGRRASVAMTQEEAPAAPPS